MWRATVTLKKSKSYSKLTLHCQRTILLDKDGVLLLVIKQTKAMTSAKCYQLPLGVQGKGSDHSRRLALHQTEWLKAWREQGRLLSHVKSSVALVCRKRNTRTAVLL